MRKKLVAANWKMNGRLDQVFSLLEPLVSEPLEEVGVLICPPYPYLLPAASILNNSAVQLGSQNLCLEEDGAFTGEVSGEMLSDCGVSHVIIGHSERRHVYGEDNDTVARKFLRAQQAGLVPILCLGETRQQRDAGQAEAVIREQLNAVLQKGGIEALGKAILAYEPVWAIGTGLTASPEQAQQIHAFIRQQLEEFDKNSANSMQILYGGSVKADNAASLFSQPDIDGGLIGGASLNADSFRSICRAAIQ